MRERAIFVAKAAFGAAVATAVALQLNLAYATAAGIITLLSLQNTKKETLTTALRRAAAFLAAVLAAFLSFSLLGYTLWGLLLYFLLFAAFCVAFSMENSLAMISVLVTHFWIEKSMALPLLVNEGLLLLIGASVGVLLNMFLPVSKGRILALQKEVEGRFKTALSALAEALVCGEGCVGTNYTKDTDALAALEESLENARKQTEQSANNALFADLRYYIEYVDMRRNQFVILRRMQQERARLSAFPKQAGEVAGLLTEVSESFRETNSADGLLSSLYALWAQFRQSPLPQTRAEFEARASLFTLFLELEHFLLIKQSFAQNLSEAEKKRYWTE